MDWEKFFKDVMNWMNAANIMLKNYPIDSAEYWKWVIDTTGRIEKRYNAHPLVVGIMVAIIRYQDEIAQSVIAKKESENALVFKWLVLTLLFLLLALLAFAHDRK